MKASKIVGLGAALLLVAASSVRADFTLSSWGGAYQEAQRKAYLDKIEQEQGIKISEDSHTGLAPVKTQVLGGKVFGDIFDLSTLDCERGRKQDL